MRHFVSFALMLSLGLLVAASAAANPEDPDSFGPPPDGLGAEGPPLGRALESVELPAEVRQAVDARLDASHRVLRELRRSLRRAHAEMRKRLAAEVPDRQAILDQADEIGRIRTALDKNRLVTLLEIREQLTPEQRERLTQALESRREARRAHRSDRPNRRPDRL